MKIDQFEITLERIKWLDDDFEELDICAHGNVFVRIGDEIVSDSSTEWCVSASALHLLRTLESNHTKDKPVGEQLIPCCGHFLVADTDNDDVFVGCCPSGIDWEVKHSNYQVKLTTDLGAEAVVSYDLYKEAIFTFADKVEAFYLISQPKEIEEEFDRKGYDKFWSEWHRRRNK
jgi:hypothetical protein